MYKVIGMMSGSSMDGMDLCHCSFKEENGKWHYSIIKAITIKYPPIWLEKLKNAPDLNSKDLLLMHFEYGKWIGEKIKENFSLKETDFISSHGHTVFHQAEKGLTFQLGHGQNIAIESGIPCISDYRTTDILLGGNGAPLVPIGDQLLFGDFFACVNLGGFANISYTETDSLYAWDICPVNVTLNYLSNKLGIEYDKNGEISRSGKLLKSLLDDLNSLDYYKKNPPKSLGREWLEKNLLPLIEESKSKTQDLLRTLTEHSAIQIAKNLDKLGHEKRILFTGGGSLNKFLIERINSLSGQIISVPDNELVNYKEALVFAFLGILRIQNKINVINTVTGAKKSSSSGVIFQP